MYEKTEEITVGFAVTANVFPTLRPRFGGAWPVESVDERLQVRRRLQ
jgi:hypothetical protein